MNSLLFLVLVIALYYFLTKNYKTSNYQHIRPGRKQQLQGALKDHEAGLLVALMAKVAKADGKVSELEAQLIGLTLTDIANTFEEATHIREELKAIYNREKETFENTLMIAKQYVQLSRSNYPKRLGLIEYLLNLAFIDGEFSAAERMITEDIARALEVCSQDFERLVARFQAFYAQKNTQKAMTLANAYALLGVSQSASFDEVKKRYRALVREHHPDVLMGQGAGQDIIDQATEKLQEINEAYELIKKHKGT
ncbi:TerB family tellurite resistance protein [Sulfurospirillum sp. T05]|uniref:TerB family tellurite resistance protein n=1 Tax=Sulfurospirillum tamanense TaxID=2813362 RepID=A0ABS2WSH9_9BACT|nr:DnaJ domain-containing protein [Sulfurospirillum tamanensis]MBN2964328.1 TerB family tellurite resistance protein [Sulfurospirillum tamanensis]